jgi:hypothetical protein
MIQQAAPSFSGGRQDRVPVVSKRPQIEFRPRDRRKPESTWLQAHRRNVTSHGGEDGIIEKIFDVIGTENKICVEFGAADGKHFSNSYNLITNHGWSGILIEPFHQFPKLQELYRDNPKVELINELVGFDKANSLDAHLRSRKMKVPRDIDFVSIDIDGNDVHVWRDMREFRPRVICIEFNHFVPLDVYMVQPKDLELCIGSSLLATAEIGKELGYELVATTAANAILVDAPLFPKFNIPDNSVEAMHFMGANETKLVPSYDGTLYIAGLARNPWKGYMIDEERIQVLPSNMRQWKFDGRPWPSKKL